MPGFNGNGTFVRAYNWTQDLDNNIPITASRFDTENDGFATGLSTCITKDGQTTITANIPFNSKKITGLAAGNARTDSLNISQVQDNQFLDLGALGGAADAYTGSPSPAVTAYASSMRFTGVIPATNLTTTPYLQLSGIADPETTGIIKKIDIDGNEIAVEVGDLVESGVYDFKRNVGNNAWIVLNPRNLSSGSFSNLSVDNLTVGETLNGSVFSTSQITLTNNGTDADNDIDFSAGAAFDTTNNIGWYSAALTKQLDNSWAAGTNAGGLDTGTKANNTWYYAYSIYNPTTNTADGIFTATQGSPTLPSGYTLSCYEGAFLTDGSGNIISGCFSLKNGTFQSGEQTITIAGSLTLAHGLGAQPKKYQAFLKCLTAEGGYSIGDETHVKDYDTNSNGDGHGCQIVPDATNLNIRFGSYRLNILNKTTGQNFVITPANWAAIFRASINF